MKLLLEKHLPEVNIGTLVAFIIIISIGPIIEPPVKPRDNTIVNADKYTNTATEIDLPIIGIGNGPFRLINS